MRYLLIFLFFTPYISAFNYHLQPIKITPQVSCFFGLHGEPHTNNGARVVNTCFIETPKGYVVIDSGPTYGYAQQAYEVMQEHKVLPVKYVINTSSQELSVLGNEFYREQGATLIGPSSYEHVLLQKKNLLNLRKKVSDKILTNTRLVPLDIYLNNDKNITLGAMTIEIKKLEKEKSKNLLVYLDDEATIFVGNFVSNSRLPTINEHYSFQEWQETLEEIEKLPWRHLISSHGIKQNRNAINNTKIYLSQLRRSVIDALHQHKSQEATRLSTTLSNYKTLASNTTSHNNNIKAIYHELQATLPTATTPPTTNSLSREERRILASMSTIETNRVVPQSDEPTVVEVKKAPTPPKTETKKRTVEKKPKVLKRAEKKSATKSVAKREVTKQEKLFEEKELPEKKEVHEIIAQSMLTSTQITPKISMRTPNIQYSTFTQAKEDAIREEKYLLIKIEANNCRPCDELNSMLATNEHIKKMINQHMKVVKVNTDRNEPIPLSLSNRGTPTLFLIEPKNDHILMKLEGEKAVEDLEDSLQLFVEDKPSDPQEIAGLAKLKALSDSLNQLTNSN